MLHSSGKYPDLKLTAVLLKLAIALICSQFMTVYNSPVKQRVNTLITKNGNQTLLIRYPKFCTSAKAARFICEINF